MAVTDKDISLIDEWVGLQQEINKLEEELNALTQKMMRLSRALYDKKSKEELQELHFMVGVILK